MVEWKAITKKNKCIEIIGIIGIFGCFVIGMVCDWNVLQLHNVLITVEDISAFSLTVLQVQATVGTLIFTIIALITGNISDSYMGVSISDYYLNIKPWILKQKVLIAISLGLCLAGVIFHALSLYNVVFYLFVATLIVIALSIRGIYSAFRGRNIQNNEIEAYLTFMLENERDYEINLANVCQ